MKKVILVLGVVFLFACNKTELTTQSSTNITQKPVAIILDSIKIIGRTDTLIISKSFKFTITGYYSDKSTKDLSDSVNLVSDKNNVTINGKSIIGAQSGKSVISVTYNKFSLKDSMYISEIENVDLSSVPFLTTPSNPNARIIVPVVVINYYPTLNGIDIDTKRAPGLGTASPIKIQDLKNRTIDNLTMTKFGLEESSKFRGYNNTNQTSNVSFKVVKYVNVYEIKRGLPGIQEERITNIQDRLTPVYQPDYFDVFNKLNLKSLVENNGVKEVWFSLRPISSEYPVVKDSLTNGITAANFLNLPESNMSSLTGDVSNSYRMLNDLPIYNKTYVVYGYNLERTASENIHNRGHQIEAQLQSVDNGIFGENTATFLNKFVGITIGKNNNKPIGRAGMTHFPPNTSKDYDYDNKSLVESDIEDWKPLGGSKKLINSDRWMNVTIQNFPKLISTKDDYNKDPQYKWLIFWMQSIPGYNNGITGVNDWWDLFYNWDNAIKNKSKLNN